jgi:hypothetical protein
MPVNLDKPHRWKEDIANSVDLYNNWFLRAVGLHVNGDIVSWISLLKELFS